MEYGVCDQSRSFLSIERACRTGQSRFRARLLEDERAKLSFQSDLVINLTCTCLRKGISVINQMGEH